MRLVPWLVVFACSAPPVAPVVRNVTPPGELPPATVAAGVIRVRVIKIGVIDDGTLVYLPAGREQGFDKRAKLTSPWYPNASVMLIRVDKITTIARTDLTRDQLAAHPFIDVTPAPPEPVDRDDSNGLLDI